MYVNICRNLISHENLYISNNIKDSISAVKNKSVVCITKLTRVIYTLVATEILNILHLHIHFQVWKTWNTYFGMYAYGTL